MSAITNCRVCGSVSLESILDLGEQYLSDFREDDSKPEKFPLHLVICNKCGLAQLDFSVSRELMYHDGYGYRSGVNELIKQNLQQIVDIAKNRVPDCSSWLDIACNDGTLLGMVGSQARRVGIDPVTCP